MELKKGETIMIDAALHLPATFLHEAFSDRSGVPLDLFELYYRGKRLEGEAALSSWGVEKDSTLEVKMRGRGGMPSQGNSPWYHRSGPQSSRPEGGAGAEAALALEAAAAASEAPSTGATRREQRATRRRGILRRRCCRFQCQCRRQQRAPSVTINDDIGQVTHRREGLAISGGLSVGRAIAGGGGLWGGSGELKGPGSHFSSCHRPHPDAQS